METQNFNSNENNNENNTSLIGNDLDNNNENLIGDNEPEQDSHDQNNSNEEKTKWFWAKGIPGEGDLPEGIDEKFIKQYGDILTAAKGVQGLRQKLGGFTGAPADGYKYELPDEFKEQFEFDSESPLYKEFTAMAKDNNMSQEMFQNMINLYVGNEILNHKESENIERDVYNIQNEQSKLGANYQERAAELREWISETLPAEEAKSFMASIKTADQFKTLEQFKRSFNHSNLPSSGIPLNTIPSYEDYKKTISDPRYLEGTPFYNDKFKNVVMPYLKYSSEQRKKNIQNN